MDFNTYINEAARTDADTFFPETVPASAMQAALVELMAAAKKVDMVKKGLFYDRRSTDLEQFVARTKKDDEYHVDQHSIHAILGIITEAGELGEILWKAQLFDEDIDLSVPKIVDETGDLTWYYAKLVRRFDLSFVDIMWKNIQKLAKRFPERFTTALANHRNDVVEQAVFQ